MAEPNPQNHTEIETTNSRTNTQTTSTQNHDLPIAIPGIKLNGQNYELWLQIMEMFISGRDKLGLITGEIKQPPLTDPTYNKWRTENAIVKGWIINSLSPDLIGNFIRFPTAKGVWDAIATTYFDGGDNVQVYDLKRKVSRTTQGRGSLEDYYIGLQSLWREIDYRRPNPMSCEEDILKYNKITQEDRIYTFLDGLDDQFDQTRQDILQQTPLSSIEQAFAQVRRENSRRTVMMEKDDGDGFSLVTKGRDKQWGEMRRERLGQKALTGERCEKELGYPMETEIKMYCDNKAAIVIANNPVQHDRNKHVKVDRHFIKQKLDEKVVIFPFVKSEDQLADILTKAVASKVFHFSLNKLGIRDIFAPI